MLQFLFRISFKLRDHLAEKLDANYQTFHILSSSNVDPLTKMIRLSILIYKLTNNRLLARHTIANPKFHGRLITEAYVKEPFLLSI